MDIDAYARACPQFFDAVVPPALERALARAKSAKTLLDAGCGDGSLARALLGRGLLEGRKLFACDAAASRVRLLDGIADNIEPLVDDIETLAHIPSGSIDVYMSSQVIEHVDDVRMIEAIERVTHPGSTVWVSTVFKRWYAWYFHRNGSEWVLDPTHVREYRRDEELVAKFAPQRFRLVESVKTPIAYPAADFVLRRLGAGRDAYARSSALRLLRRLEVPILGYRTWELVFERIG